MQELDQILAYIFDNVDGTVSVAVGGMDGLLIEQYPPQSDDLSAVTAEQTNILNTTTLAYTQLLEGGDLKEIIVVAGNLLGYTRILGEELFCLVILSSEGNIGKARLYSNQAAKKVLQVLT